MKGKTVAARLILEDGSEFAGLSHAHHASVAGEVVFTTGMAGYNQSLSDPSYTGQILVSTYPLIGNYGVPGDAVDGHGIPLFFESEGPKVTAFVVSEYCEEPSHYASERTLAQWLAKGKVPLISGIDVRALTERLRAKGVMRGKILVEGSKEVSIESGDIPHPVAAVSCKGRQVFEATPDSESSTGRGLRVLVVDCGMKHNIFRSFLKRGATVIRVPWDYDFSGEDYDALFLSNGPGDPKTCTATIEHVRKALSGAQSPSTPIFGICLGNQILSLAAGADTYKLPFGHRSQNQPCVEVGSKRCFITSQNHGYAVRTETLPPGWEPWFVNGNDGSNEGVRHKDRPWFSVQFHPEGCPGPRDTEYLFDVFLEKAREAKGGKA